MSFSLPPINDNPDGGWGPSSSNFPEQFKFKDIPYAPYSKSDKLGRFADWNETSSDTRQNALGTASAQNTRTGPGGRRREGAQAFGSGTASAFAYFHVEDESSFSLVDNKTAPPRRGGTFIRGRGTSRGGAGNYNTRGGAQRGGRGFGGRGGNAQRGRRGWRDWDKNARTRESSVVISPQWSMLEEIEFHRLAKLRLEVDEPENIDSYGRLYAYDKSFDRITTKTEKPLQQLDRIKYNTTTSDDPVIQQLVSKNTATIYTTDVILSVLMCAPRSVYPWDIVIVREGNSLFFDKRDGGPFDTVTVNENASDPPQDPPPPNPNNPNEKIPDAPSINSATSLSLEATYVNQNFAFQTVVETPPPPGIDLANPNPFYGPDETEPLASCGYRYRVFDLSVQEDENFKICVRTEVDAYLPGSGNPREGHGLVTIRALNEFDPRAPGAGGAPDWRTKLDSQRGAVVATEMKNNSCKLAKWTVQSILAGAESMKIGYVSRSNPRDAARHVILSTASMRPADFAAQLNVSLNNGWGIVRTVADLCMKMPEGKYVLVKDPNKPLVRLYAIPSTSFSGVEDEEGEGFEDDEA
ncbi:eukaryotic translation initiation factor 3 subunit D [Lentinula raphanica]|uniref:Eukaryotic translation initiation factor 3 subunit D n=1 Tax=Lentinula raphanica TaxID=153919 RepID=A0AA38P2D5_9AGAR|nr:translation initiation factor eIF-3 subunit D [Lentinula raphanica]KAJ3771575.1 eukaryotic translation initiation factor 3 subunit D [Lentinula raphanica]KAJ3819719.1 eukaryotic translation initiation factor 3 subunit D [Lentinula raphanica]KAJ3835042.1 eukaryotic translation initiation factor 3 subunit D [Lentinula raphanica]KAJ3970721.1 eukaryotic translation initiation factor 3 subunit D [Lentinula raphanica]